MLPDRVSNRGPLTYESGALPIALRGPAIFHSSPSKVEILKIFVRTCVENYCTLWSNFEMKVCFEQLGGMCALFYENRLGIKKNLISLFT